MKSLRLLKAVTVSAALLTFTSAVGVTSSTVSATGSCSAPKVTKSLVRNTGKIKVNKVSSCGGGIEVLVSCRYNSIQHGNTVYSANRTSAHKCSHGVCRGLGTQAVGYRWYNKSTHKWVKHQPVRCVLPQPLPM